MTVESTLERPGVESSTSERTGPVYRLNVDIFEGRDELVVVGDVPGVTQDDIDVHFEDGTLSIRAHVKARRAENTRYLLQEYGVGDYYRAFRLSEDVDASRISAQYADGVLTLHLPKSEAAKPRKINVQA